MKPNGELIGRGKTIIEDNIIIFRIDKDFTDNVDEIGIYKIQFHIYDTLDNRITIPPISFEVKELLGIIDEFDSKYGIVDNSYTDICNVLDDGKEIDIFLNGKYIKTIWNTGDLISSSKLNKIEEAIEYLDNQFHIGSKSLCKDPLIWVDVPDLDSSNLNEIDFVESKILTNTNEEECISNNINPDMEILSETLNNIVDKVKVLEEEIEILNTRLKIFLI